MRASAWVTKILNNYILFILSVYNLGRLTSDNYATNERKRIFGSCFCLEVTIFLKSSKRSMADRKR